jgi:hypothetical protein
MKSGKHRFARLALGFAMVALAAWPVTAETVMPAPAHGAKCDRSCLKEFVDKYLDAVVAHDPGRLPWTSDVKFAVYIADRYSNVAGVYGVVMEKAEPRLLSLRLLIKNGRLYEIEAVMALGTGLPYGGRAVRMRKDRRSSRTENI